MFPYTRSPLPRERRNRVVSRCGRRCQSLQRTEDSDHAEEKSVHQKQVSLHHMTRDELAQSIHDKSRRIHQGVVGLGEEPSLDEMRSAFSQRPPNPIPSRAGHKEREENVNEVEGARFLHGLGMEMKSRLLSGLGLFPLQSDICEL